MRSVILAFVFVLILAAPAQAQFLVPNMNQPYGGNWYWSYPVVPMPYYYGGNYGGYRGGYRDGYYDRGHHYRSWDYDSPKHHHHGH